MAKQVIAIGSAPNDGNGDTLRDAMDKCNDNFTELYDDVAEFQAVLGSPCMGTKYTPFRAAIKFFIIRNSVANSDLFYVSKIENGVSGHVIIEVSKTYTLASAGTVVLSSDRTTAAKTGWEIVALSEANSSGLYGRMIIDWDELTAATSYTCANWPEGGLYAVNLYEGAPSGGGPSERLVTFDDDLTDADGSYSQYVFNGATDKSITMEEFANLKGTVVVNNISDTHTATLYAHADEQATSEFNGTARAGIVVEPGTFVEVAVIAEAQFIVKGAFSEIA